MVVSGTEAPALATWFDAATRLPPTRAALWRTTDGKSKKSVCTSVLVLTSIHGSYLVVTAAVR